MTREGKSIPVILTFQGQKSKTAVVHSAREMKYIN